MTFSAAQIEALKIGDLAPYWGQMLPIIKIEPVREVLFGANKGSKFRYVHIASPTGNAEIGFILSEGSTY